ncbi:MAG: rod shape-determining protein MreD [Bacteroidales bacterium]|nr:rod shape-determining protein MreD [Bacteroidales bacterium]
MNINILTRNILRFIILVMLQILVFNNIGILGLGIVPAFFILYILLLPFETPGWLVLVLAFSIGLIIDIFSDTIGLNTAASVFTAFLRPIILRSLSPRDGYEVGTFPRIHYMGMNWFIKYASGLVFSHQLLYYFLENFTFAQFGFMLLKVLVGTFFSLLLIIVSQFFIYKK